MEGWKKIKLSEVLSEVSERNKNEKVKLVLSVTNSQGFVKQEDFFEGTVHSENIENYKIVHRNEFAYNPSRINVGSIDILNKYDEGALSPMYVIFKVDESRLLPEYFKYYFQTHRFQENVKNNTQGSVRNSLSFKALSEFEYLLPPIDEQRKIIKILDNVNRIIEKYQDLIQEKEQFIKSQFVEMFEKGGYKEVLLGEEFIINSGGTPDKKIKEYWEPREISWIGSNLCRDKVLYENDGKYISIEGLKHSSAKIFKSDTVLVALVGATIGKTALLKFETTTNQNIAGIECNDSFNSEYVFYAMQNLYNVFVKLNVGNFKMANLSFIRNLRIKKPPIELQNKFSDLVKLIDKQKFHTVIKNLLIKECEVYV